MAGGTTCVGTRCRLLQIVAACLYVPFVSKGGFVLAELARDGVPKNQSTGPKPRIYVYDLPADKWRNEKDPKQIFASFYGLDVIFPELLLNSSHVTSNPEEADYFYAHVWMYWPHKEVSSVVEELRRLGPWWDRRHGKDHIFVITRDTSRCFNDDKAGINATFLHHFGKLTGHIQGRNCDLLNMWGSSCDDVMLLAETALRKATPLAPCHIPGQDIVVPPVMYEYVPDTPSTHKMYTPYIHKEMAVANRSTTLFYSGRIDLFEDRPEAQMQPWLDAYYSLGARQTVYHLFGHRPGFQINTHHTPDDYWNRTANSWFCLAAAGWAWGGRFKSAATRGCIPVILQDGVRAEWEEVVPLRDYAVRVPMWMAHKLDRILDLYISSGRAARMQRVLECAWRLHWWNKPYGRAFELTMCELKRRLLGAQAVRVDWDSCTMYCGDDVPVRLKEELWGLPA